MCATQPAGAQEAGIARRPRRRCRRPARPPSKAPRAGSARGRRWSLGKRQERSPAAAPLRPPEMRPLRQSPTPPAGGGSARSASGARPQQRRRRAERQDEPASRTSSGAPQRRRSPSPRGVPRRAPLIEKPRHEIQRGHQRRAPHRRARRDEVGVRDEHASVIPAAGVPAPPRTEESHAQRREDRDVPARDGDDVVRAGRLEPHSDLVG